MSGMPRSSDGRKRRDWGETVLTRPVGSDARALLDSRAARLKSLEALPDPSSPVVAEGDRRVVRDARELLRDTIDATLAAHVTGKNPDQRVFPPDYVANLYVMQAQLNRQLGRGNDRGAGR